MSNLYIGLMSGTSLDGVDGVVVGAGEDDGVGVETARAGEGEREAGAGRGELEGVEAVAGGVDRVDQAELHRLIGKLKVENDFLSHLPGLNLTGRRNNR